MLGLVGIVILAYAALVYIEYERAIKPPSAAAFSLPYDAPSALLTSHHHTIITNNKTTTPHPWFVEATAAAGLLTVGTAMLGTLAGCYPNVWTLNTYSFSLSAVVVGMVVFVEVL